MTVNDTIQALEREIQRAEYVCSNYCDVEITTIKNAVDIMKNQRLKIKELEELLDAAVSSERNLADLITDTSVSLVDGHIEAEKGR